MNTECPTCGSDCNERDMLDKAEREIDRLTAQLEQKWTPKRLFIDGVPPLGEPVVVAINGVWQQETFSLDQGDDGFGGGEYFWDREGLDECPAATENDWYVRLPPTQQEK